MERQWWTVYGMVKLECFHLPPQQQRKGELTIKHKNPDVRKLLWVWQNTYGTEDDLIWLHLELKAHLWSQTGLPTAHIEFGLCQLQSDSEACELPVMAMITCVTEP